MYKFVSLFCILVAFGLSYQYNRIKKNGCTRIWFTLRLILLLLIAITVTWPSINLPSREVHQVLAIDSSASMLPYKNYAIHLASDFINQESKGSKDCITFGQSVKSFNADSFGKEQTTDLQGLFIYLKDTYKDQALSIEVVTDGRITEAIPDLSFISPNWTIKTTPVQGLNLVDVAITNLEASSTINLDYTATVSGDAHFIISGKSGIVLEESIKIEKGQHQILLPLSATVKESTLEEGTLKGQLILDGDQVPYNDIYPLDRAISENQMYLILSDKPDQLPQTLLALLNAGDIDYNIMKPDQVKSSVLNNKVYDGFILYDCPGQAFSPVTIESMKNAIHTLGKACFVIGGQNSFGLGSYASYGLEDFMPVEDRVSGPEEQGNSDLVIVLDTSGSMEDTIMGTKKITMAKSGVASVLNTLHPEDSFGLIAFSDTYEWLMPFDQVSKIPAIEEDFLSIGAKGGTLIKPSLVKAYQALSQKNSAMENDKHILLITDGQGDQEAYEDLVQQLIKQKITLSTIGIGEEIAEDFLMTLAQKTDGSYHKVERISDLPSIMVRDIYENSKETHQKGRFMVTDTENGQAKGFINNYIATTPKKDSQVLLDLEGLDPLLVKRSYGVGQVAVLTARLESSWTGNFLDSHDNSQRLIELLKTLPLKVNEDGLTLQENENRLHIYTSDKSIKRLDLIYQGDVLVSEHVASDGKAFIYPMGNEPGLYQVNAYNDRDELISHLQSNHIYSSEFSIDTEPLWMSHPEVFNQEGVLEGQSQVKTKYITWPIICLLFIGSVYYRGK